MKYTVLSSVLLLLMFSSCSKKKSHPSTFMQQSCFTMYNCEFLLTDL
jgi:hypothetical protein